MQACIQCKLCWLKISSALIILEFRPVTWGDDSVCKVLTLQELET